MIPPGDARPDAATDPRAAPQRETDMQLRRRHVACAVLLLALALTACDEPDHLALAEEAYRARDCEVAVSHLDAEIERGTKNSNVYLFRGMVRSFCLGQFAAAIPDYDQAIDLIEPERRRTSEVRHAFRGRGMARFMLGEFGQAAEDFAAGVNLQPGDVRARVLWGLAVARLGADPTDQLREFTAGREEAGWPRPLLGLLLGEIGPQECLAAAADPDPEKARGNLCEAHFYIGEYLLLGGDTEGAAAHFRDCVATGASDYNEHMLARERLKRLERSEGEGS
jgi:lipoprotein NlpI